MQEVAAELVPWTRSAVVIAFVTLTGLAVVRSVRWGGPGGWAAGAFGAITVALVSSWAPESFDIAVPAWLDGSQLLVLLLFPYLLMRFTGSFEPFSRRLTIFVTVVTAAVMLTTLARLLLDRSAWALYVPVVLVYWLGVSAISIVRLWRSGREQATVARRRMRLMSAAAAVLAATLLAVGLLSALQLPDYVVRLGVNTTMLISGIAFGLGFAPPRLLRLAWRRPEEQRLMAGTIAVLSAETREEVAEELLPPTARIVGGAGAALIDSDLGVWATHGDAPPIGTSREAAHQDGAVRLKEVISLGSGPDELVVWTSPYTPFFAREERDLLMSMGAMASLALERCRLLKAERSQQAMREEANARLQDALEEATTAKREAEHAREEATVANRAKTEFLARMSHELRTPLNAILGFGQLLETTDLPADAHESVHYILKGGRHLLGLINEVLDLAGIETGTLTLSLETVHAGELINDTLAMIQPLADSRGITVTATTDDCDSYVVTDRQRCRQVLLNLLANAVKYNRDGGSVYIHCVEIGDELLRISIRDTGPGIDPERRARLFEPFDRLDAEGSNVEGTGLGLALSKQLMERLGGAIGVESSPGDGATFWIDLPVTESPGETLGELKIPPLEGQTTQQWTLLLVEDNLVNLHVVQGMLRRRPGVTILPAIQGHMALELAYEHRPDVILLDLHLPDMSGRDVLTRLRADPRTCDIPVVIASADASPRRAEQLRAEGAFEYLSKPLELREFLRVMDRAAAAR